MATSTPLLTTPPAKGAHVNFVNSSEVRCVNIDGKKFKITRIQVLINDKWQNVDLDKYDLQELADLAKTCQKIHKKLGGNNAKTLTFHFEQKSVEQPFGARFSDKYRVAPTLQFKKLETKTSDGKTEIQALENFGEPVQLDVQRTVKKIEKQTERFFANPKNYLKLQQGKASPTPENVIDQAVQEAGSLNNRCAARSIAQRELAEHGNIQAIIDKYKLDSALAAELNAKKGDEQVTALSEALITKAAGIIGNSDMVNNSFLSVGVDPDSQRAPCFQAIHSALEAHKAANPSFEIPVAPQAAVAAYAALISQDGTMLDLPFFLALNQPLIILQKFDGGYKIITTSANLTIPELNTFDLSKVNIVVYNGTNHYQAIIPKTKAQTAAIKQLLGKTIQGNITNFITNISKDPFTPANLDICSGDAQKLFKMYPAAKGLIIQQLGLKASLSKETPTEFARAVRVAMGKSIPSIEVVD